VSGRYPSIPAADTVDVLHGITVADPYRALEDPGAEVTERWCEAQDELFATWFEADGTRTRWRERFAARVRELLPGFVGLPAPRGGRLFCERRQPDEDHPMLLVNGRVLVDPSAMSADHTTTLDGWWPSPDGDRLAYVVSEGGTEEALLRVIDVETGHLLDGPIVCGRGVDLAWIPGGEEIVYVRRLGDGQRPEGEEQFHRRVWRRRLGTAVAEDLMMFGEGRDKTAYYGVDVSRDGRWVVVTVSLGTAPRNDVYIGELPVSGVPTWAVVQEDEDVLTYPHVGFDGRLYLMTDRDAPRWKLAVARPDRPGRADWSDLVPESDGVLESFALTDDAVVVCRTRDVAAELSVVDRLTGDPIGPLVLPGLGGAAVTSRPEGGGDVWVSYGDHLTPPSVLHADLAGVGGPSGRPAPGGPLVLRPWADPPGRVPLAGAWARRVWVSSDDGTRVPMFLIAAGDPGRRRATVLYGYGGFDVALSPAYSATAAAWVEAGGVWAIANLRGGSEFGESWHRAGMRARKQNVFDDFAACARWLVAEGWAEPARLGIYGGSNGGLLVGAAMTQHPDQFAAVVCSAPLLDMVRYERFGLGITWNDEYGTADVAEELAWLLAYSPYHHVVDGVGYPATLFTVFDADTRVDPLHARKMCASLQASTAAGIDEAPILFRREARVGHATRSVGRTTALSADILAFLADRLALGE